MANLADHNNSSITFTSSSYISNGSINTPPEISNNLEAISLSKLSCNLGRLLIESEFDCSDAEIVIDGDSIPIHRCILAARSKFFHELFSREIAGEKGGRLRYEMRDLVGCGRVGKEAFMAFLSYLYTGKLRAAPAEASTCVDGMCAHDACRPAVNFVVEMMYASCVFQIVELVSLFQRRLLNFVDKALVEDVISILLVAFRSNLSQLQSHCVQRVARSDLDNVALEKEIPMEVVEEIKSIRSGNQPNDSAASKVDPIYEKSIRRIHRALDSDDVELVKLLLTESGVTLDDAFALHYAAAYCDSKVVAEVLDMGLANVNLQNERGYTPLHIAAMRREPAVIVSLLTKGASASETTPDGQTAVSICRRLTRAKDYYAKTEQGQESNKDKLCIDILEREIRCPLAGDKAVTSPLLAGDLHMKLLYLENRVDIAKLLFPSEAKLAMKIAQAEATSEFTGISASRSASNLREVDLNETPSTQNKRLHSRVEALLKTVELGRRYFPNCSEVLDKFMEDDLLDLFYLQKGTPEEQNIKRMRFSELKDDVYKAFNKDKAVSARSGFSYSGFSSSSSSSSSLKGDQKQQKASRK